MRTSEPLRQQEKSDPAVDWPVFAAVRSRRLRREHRDREQTVACSSLPRRVAVAEAVVQGLLEGLVGRLWVVPVATVLLRQ